MSISCLSPPVLFSSDAARQGPLIKVKVLLAMRIRMELAFDNIFGPCWMIIFASGY
jgi:hypothetical protein